MKITELTVHELIEKLKNRELTSTEITQSYIDRIKEKEPEVQAFVTTLEDEAIKQSGRFSFQSRQMQSGMIR